MTNDNGISSEGALTLRAARVLIARYRRQRERAISLADNRYQLRMRALLESLMSHTSMEGHESQVMALLQEELQYIPVAVVDTAVPPPPVRSDGVQVQLNGRRPLADITNQMNNRSFGNRQ